MNRLIAATCLLLLVTLPVRADDAPRYNQVNLAAQSSEQVANDTLQVTLTTYGEDAQLAKLAAQINADMDWALAKVKPHADVKSSTGSYQTYPVTSKDGRTTTGWRGQQTLQLESRSITALGALAGELQDRLRITAMQFTVSNERRTAVENRLVDAALDAFKTRARIVADNLKARDYRIVNVSINTSSSMQPPVMYRSKLAMASVEADSAVAVEGGESEVQVSVNGTIELVLP